MVVTLRDIAGKAGAHVSTVARVLNDDRSRGVSEEKRQRILRCAKELGYTPNRPARALRTGRRFNVAYVLPEPAGTRTAFELPFARFRLYGLEQTLDARGYLLSLLHLDPGAPEAAQEKACRQRRVDGLVFNYHAPSPQVAAALRHARVPAVVIDADVFRACGGSVSCVLSDRAGGVAASLKRLIAQGHSRIAFIATPDTPERWEGYRRAMKEAGIAIDRRLVLRRPVRDPYLSAARTHGREMARELLASSVAFTAVQAASDFKAAGVIDALREAGRRVPEDVAVVGFDDVDGMGVPPFDEPFLTTIRDPNFEMGVKAAELLLEEIEKGTAPRRVVLPTELVIRQSG
ncbi:MAG: LacI family transcriptional regulator [Planctomycetes bacterium]|nr:LacI family transcriptional regulator [Planctomycetota bacterium]